MHGFCSLFLITACWGVHQNQQPTIILVPTQVLNWITLPDPDFSGNLAKGNRFSDVLGGTYELEALAHLVANPAGTAGTNPAVVRLFVDQNSLSHKEVRKAVNRLQRHWPKGHQAIVIFELGHVEYGCVPPGSEMGNTRMSP
jgi:hypothetical protein